MVTFLIAIIVGVVAAAVLYARGQWRTDTWVRVGGRLICTPPR